MSSTTRALKRPGFAPVVIVLVLAEIISAFELSMMYVMLPTLIRDFQVDANTVAWVVTAYLLVSASAAVLGGRFGDMYGRRKVMVIVLVVAAIGSLISLLGGSLGMIIFGRAIQGVAGAVLGLAFGLAREHLDEKRVPVGISMVGASALIAGAGGSMIAGFMIDLFSWHGIFVFAAVLAVIAALAIQLVIPRDTNAATSDKPDYIGAILLPIAVSALLLGLSNSSKTGFMSVEFLGLIGLGLAAAAVWAWWELRVESPIVNLRMFKNRQIALAMTATVFAAIGPLGGVSVPSQMIMQSPSVLGYGLGLTPTSAGVLICLTALVGFALSPLGGKLAFRYGARIVFIAGLVLMALAIPVILLTYGNTIVYLLAMTMNGVGISLTYGALPNLLIEVVPESHTSETAGTNTMIRNVGQSAAIAIGAFILASNTDPTTKAISQEGISGALILVLVFGVLAVVMALMLSRNPKPWVPETVGERDIRRGTTTADPEDIVSASA
ncbi:MFS transporter [Arthrobacter sp. zg-Y1219]|uniref:MFS transporter n=1 Tax=Arthrobacter sp. zg-Y1219 TaxID=3049067 RepID=UPI0024C3A272|nr:MFS transporter [Arthrobacter sp. zg-Y1219]MDK1359965.1 MFS transporter [Arthrobacter sp. zg-Y1219]